MCLTNLFTFHAQFITIFEEANLSLLITNESRYERIDASILLPKKHQP